MEIIIITIVMSIAIIAGLFFGFYFNASSIKWRKFKQKNIRISYGNNRKKATEINMYINTFFSNEKLCKICENFVDENYHNLPNLGNLELSFLPYIYNAGWNAFKITKIKKQKDISSSLYEKIIRNYSETYLQKNKIKATKIFCTRNGYYTGFSTMIELLDDNYSKRLENIKGSKLEKLLSKEKENDLEFSSGFNIIQNFYDMLCNQNIINNNDNINNYHAFLFVIYFYKIQQIYTETKLYINEYNININTPSYEIFKELYDKHIEKSIISYILTYKELVNSNFSKSLFLELTKNINYVNEQSKTADEQKTINDLLNDNYKKKIKIRIEEIDLMNGEEFEYFITQLFNTMGYKATHTKLSGDQGVDVIAEKDNIKIVIQTKCYHNVVGNKAIQEAVAGMKYYDANKAMVITNSTFTKSAIELAQKNNVQLWDRKTLIEKINEIL